MSFITIESISGIATLVVLEIVLGIDNIIFINLMVSRLPQEQRQITRQVGLMLALCSRLLLLACIGLLLSFNQPLFTVLSHPFSLMQLLLIAGGSYLLGKSIQEIHILVEYPHNETHKAYQPSQTRFGVLIQIVLMDMVFSLDSIFTAFGVVTAISWMVIAIIIAMGVMLFLTAPIGHFLDKNPSLKLLAMGFLMMIGTLLIADGFDHHFDRNYLYFAILFALLIEGLNLRRLQRKSFH